MSHRIDIESAIEDYVPEQSAQERDNLLALLYCWRDEAVTDARRAILPACLAEDPTGRACILPADRDGEHYAVDGKSAWTWRR